MKSENINSLKIGDSVRFVINGVTRSSRNYVNRVTDNTVLVQVNEPGSVLHCSLLEFPKATNEVTVIGYGGKAVYNIAK